MSSPEASVAAAPSKRTPRKAAAPRGKWSAQQLLTSDKSVLIDSDLVKLLASSAAWSCLEEDEKRQILALLPADTHPESELSPDDPDAKIPPLPDSFVRYSNNWRDGIRQFQLDLQNGRYDPEWLRQAEEARNQREHGDFDSFKEREFEQFWGQKQKMDMRALAGESSRIKLAELVDAGVILLGDVWRFTFVFGKGEQRVVIDKEIKVHEINNSKLTFKVPPGQRVFLRHNQPEPTGTQGADQAIETADKMPAEQSEVETERPEEKVSTSDGVEEGDSGNGRMEDDCKEEIKAEGSSPRLQPQVVLPDQKGHDSNTVTVVISNSAQMPKRPVSPAVCLPESKRRRGRPRKVQSAEPQVEDVEGVEEAQTPMDCDDTPFKSAGFSVEITNAPQAIASPVANDETAVVPESPKDIEEPIIPPQQPDDPPIIPLPQPDDPPIDVAAPSPQDPVDEPDEIILQDITSPHNLVMRLIEIDGRKGKEARTSNAWKEIRCYRNNQDIGGLWDLREAWYLKQQGTS